MRTTACTRSGACSRSSACGEARVWRSGGWTFDAERGRLSVNASLVPTEGGFVFQEPKTACGRRTVSLDVETVAALKEHRERQLLERAMLGEAYSDHDLIFCREDGMPIDPRSVSQRFRTLATKVPTIRLHDLRHTAATLGLAAGVPAKVMQERLGHSSITMTLGLYSHVLPSMEAAAADRIAELVAS